MKTIPARRTITTVMAVAAAASALLGPGPASAAPLPRAGVCARADRQWARVVAIDKRTKTAFAKAQALQERLIRAGRPGVAHRLDIRLEHLRQLHAELVNRAAVIAARVRGQCPDRSPSLGTL
jgi:hypothetical protein